MTHGLIVGEAELSERERVRKFKALVELELLVLALELDRASDDASESSDRGDGGTEFTRMLVRLRVREMLDCSCRGSVDKSCKGRSIKT